MKRLHPLVRYVARSPLSLERLSRASDGRLIYKLKHRWRDGTTHVVFEPADFITKLAALVPPPRAHLVRYHGLLAPCASERDRVVPAALRPNPALDAGTNKQHGTIAPGTGRDRLAGSEQRGVPSENDPVSPTAGAGSSPATPKGGANGRPSWSYLMRRVFAFDVLQCPKCGARMRIIAAICGHEAKDALLECLGLPARAPPVAAPDAQEPHTNYQPN